MDYGLISIIMGVYNCEKTVARCIDSIRSQTYTNWEFIICDDCSTDQTLKILQEYEKTDNRIKVIKNKKNSKLAFSLNHCLKYANGKYIARMDADDECIDNRLETQAEFLEKHQEYSVVGSTAYIFDGKDIVGTRKMCKIPTKKEVIFGPTFMHPTIMMRKEVYRELDGYTVSKRTVRGQDWDLWFRFFAKGFKGYNIQTPLLIYHESGKDMKKRTLKAAIMSSETALYGYRKLKLPWYMYILALKPIMSFFKPSKLLRMVKRI